MIRFRGRSLELREGETVLECLERSGEVVPSSCRSGVCQSCLLQATSGDVPPESQKGLKPSLRRRGFLLACACRPSSDLSLSVDETVAFDSRVLESHELAPGVHQVLLEKPAALEFAAGQFLHVIRASDGLTRPYSIASLPSEGPIELHVALRPEGAMSRWLPGAVGEPLRLRGPLGDCSYQPGDPERPLLLVGTGTGLAPLLGVIRDALARGHRGPITLHHGSSSSAGLYQWQALCLLAEKYPNLQLTGWVLEPSDTVLPFMRVGRIGRELVEQYASLQRAEIYLCGNPGLVASLKKFAYLRGASLSNIYSDPFVTAPPRLPLESEQASIAG